MGCSEKKSFGAGHGKMTARLSDRSGDHYWKVNRCLRLRRNRIEAVPKINMFSTLASVVFRVKSDGVVFLPFVETSSVMASGTGTCLVL